MKNIIKFIIGFIAGFAICSGINIIKHNTIVDFVYNIDNVEANETYVRFVYTFPLTYGELVPAAEKILSDEFISVREGIMFSNLIAKVQAERKNLRNDNKDNKLLEAKKWWKTRDKKG